MVPRSGLSARAGNSSRGLQFEKTPFADLAAVIVVTSAMKSRALNYFRSVTRATSHASKAVCIRRSWDRDHKVRWCWFSMSCFG